MIEYKAGDIFNEDVEAIVNTVNCVGVMGRGIALQFKNAYPENFKAYAAACKCGEVKPGNMFVFRTNQVINPKFIINFPTKRHWKGKSRMEDIESGLVDLISTIRRLKIRSIAIPPLGSGLGGLDWTMVRSKIEESLKSMTDVHIVVFEPTGAPSPEGMKHVQEPPRMTTGRAALVGLTDRYLRGLLDPFITLLEIHKLMYFMQEAGENLKLEYKKAHYGPFAENLSHVLKRIEGHFVTGYSDGGDNPQKPIELIPSAIETASVFLLEHPETHHRFERVTDLVDGFESPFGLELLSTVHWVIKRENANSMDDVIQSIHAWSSRKKDKFSLRQIEIAITFLTKKGWVEHDSLSMNTEREA